MAAAAAAAGVAGAAGGSWWLVVAAGGGDEIADAHSLKRTRPKKNDSLRFVRVRPLTVAEESSVRGETTRRRVHRDDALHGPSVLVENTVDRRRLSRRRVTDADAVSLLLLLLILPNRLPNSTAMTEYKLVVVGGESSSGGRHLGLTLTFFFLFVLTAGGVGKSALTIQLIQNQ